MTSVGEVLHRVARGLARSPRPGPNGPEITRQLAYRAVDPIGPHETWDRRILELADGTPVREIIEVLYGEEVKAGAWSVDVGLWKGLFDRSVVETITTLETKGLIYLKPDILGKEDLDGPDQHHEKKAIQSEVSTEIAPSDGSGTA